MKRLIKKKLLVTVASIGLLLSSFYLIFGVFQGDPFYPLYLTNCAGCHGRDFEGTNLGQSLLSTPNIGGNQVSELIYSITTGAPDRGMPAFDSILSPEQIRSVAILVAERQQQIRFIEFNMEGNHDLRQARQSNTELSIETFFTGLSDKPYSIAVLPNDQILVTEKSGSLISIAKSGSEAVTISGTPKTGSIYFKLLGLDFGVGYLHDIQPHPDFQQNGWLYLLHSHICEECGGPFNIVPATTNRLIRGRIEDNSWVNEEILWQADKKFYSSSPDIGLGGRITFDQSGHVYFSIGVNGLKDYDAPAHLTDPYRKVHRIRDDGSIPEDNPFYALESALTSIWTYGHRTPQGLEFDPITGSIWESEMGPRGGDEINLLRAGSNYGWPMISNGLHYFGNVVAIEQDQASKIELKELEYPVVDLTPAPAISSFIVYQGDEFPHWQGDLIVGSLKAGNLYRFSFRNAELEESEILLTGLPRIRDIEQNEDGKIFLLTEQAEGSSILRLSASLNQ